MRKNWDDFFRLQDELNSLFNYFAYGPFAYKKRHFLPVKRVNQPDFRMPITDVQETDKEVIVVMELPGVEKNEIELSVDQDRLQVKTEKKQKKQKKGNQGYYLSEKHSSFYREIFLPAKVDSSKVQANYKNGVLEVVLKKLSTKKKSRKIKIN